MASLPTGSSHLSSVDDVAVEVDTDATRHGVVAWFCSDRGFGQLRTRTGELVYVDQRDILREGFRALEPGQHVTWVPGNDVHGQVARHVVVQASESAIAS